MLVYPVHVHAGVPCSCWCTLFMLMYPVHVHAGVSCSCWCTLFMLGYPDAPSPAPPPYAACLVMSATWLSELFMLVYPDGERLHSTYPRAFFVYFILFHWYFFTYREGG
eukprot:1586575-Pyramimonas_sp.AAC.1